MAASSKTSLIQKIDQKFQKLFNKHGYPPIHTIDNIDQQICLDNLKIYGVYIVEAFDQSIYINYIEQLCYQLYSIIFDIYLDPQTSTFDYFTHNDYVLEYHRMKKKYKDVFDHHSELVLATLCNFWNSSSGFGNSSFRFIYMQFLDNNPTFNIDAIGKPIEFNLNLIHRFNIRLLASYPQIWQLFKSIYGDHKPIVSWDSTKVRFQDTGKINGVGMSKITKATATTTTTRHHDIYDDDIQRIQAMIIMQHKDAVSLGWTMFSNNPKIRSYIKEYLGSEYKGFHSINDPELSNILDKYWIAPHQGFVMWDQATYHYEGVVVNNDCNMRIFGGIKASPDQLRRFSILAAIGTHVPTELSSIALKQLCFLSEKGWLPEVYIHDKKNNLHTSIIKNMVNVKSSQWKKPRTIKPNEKEQLMHVAATYHTNDSIDQFIGTLDPHILNMYGIYD